VTHSPHSFSLQCGDSAELIRAIRPLVADAAVLLMRGTWPLPVTPCDWTAHHGPSGVSAPGCAPAGGAPVSGAPAETWARRRRGGGAGRGSRRGALVVLAGATAEASPGQYCGACRSTRRAGTERGQAGCGRKTQLPAAEAQAQEQGQAQVVRRAAGGRLGLCDCSHTGKLPQGPRMYRFFHARVGAGAGIQQRQGPSGRRGKGARESVCVSAGARVGRRGGG